MKQMDRRLLILMRLREERAARAQDLAEECGCSVRTIYRDIEGLCEAGVPVAALPGEGYRLVPGYHLPPIAFTVEEAVQLLLGSDFARGLGTAAQGEAARSAAAKVEAALTPHIREEVTRMRERMRVAGGMRGERSPWLPVLQEALMNDRLLFLRYHSYSPDDITERKVEPYALVFYDRDWHLVAYCRMREGMRDFRAGRILAAEVLEEQFRRNPAIAPYENDMYEAESLQEVRVWVEASAVPWARENPGFGLEREEPGGDGSTFVFRVRDIRRLMPWILSRGASARVLSPPLARERLRQEAEAMAESYRAGPMRRVEKRSSSS